MKQCQCFYEPRGDHGLEGFDRDCVYFFEEKKDILGKYNQIYLNPDYYETCSLTNFKKYFKEIL